MNGSADLLSVPARALAVGAHPDDIEFQCGATLAKWAEAGCEVHLLILTDGSKGSWDTAADTRALTETRKREAQEAGGALGAAGLHFLNFVDGELESSLTNRASVCAVIRETAPDVVIGHDPWKRYRLHPDHRHAGFLTVDGLVAARDPHFFPGAGGGTHHRPGALLLFEADEPDYWEPVEEHHVAAKIAALLCHRSQWRSTMGIHDRLDEERRAFEESIMRKTSEAGLAAGLAYAESFRRLSTD